MENDIKKLIEEVLEKGYLMSLGTLDEGGVWVADVIYVHDDYLNMYWMSDPDVRHSKALKKNPLVALSITSNAPKEDNMGIQCFGEAEKIEGPRMDLAKKHYAKRKKPEPGENEDVLGGYSWYVVKPKSIDLIYEKLFGFKKQKIEL